MQKLFGALLLSITLFACGGESGTKIDTGLALDSSLRSPGHNVRVMTWNTYIGADIGIVLTASTPAEIPALASQAFQELVATNFPERAIALAEEIRVTRPQLIGLQEMTLIRLQSPGDAIIGGTIPAEDV